jgi:hypothetical protein
MSTTTTDVLAHANLQLTGMKRYPDPSKTAPISVEEIEKNTIDLQAKKNLQENLKAQLHEATIAVDAGTKLLNAQVERNVSHFVAIWGKTDPRLEEVGGHPLGRKHYSTEKDKA